MRVFRVRKPQRQGFADFSEDIGPVPGWGRVILKRPSPACTSTLVGTTVPYSANGERKVGLGNGLEFLVTDQPEVRRDNQFRAVSDQPICGRFNRLGRQNVKRRKHDHRRQDILQVAAVFSKIYRGTKAVRTELLTALLNGRQ